MSMFTPRMECCGYANCLHIPIDRVDREESKERKDKRITMAQHRVPQLGLMAD